MKRLTEEDLARIRTKPMGRSSWQRNILLSMEVGEAILLGPKDWTWKRKPPSTLCRRLERDSSRKYDCQKALDGSGWVIRRVK